uniref:ribonuclease H n=1 Tax=viral metagenome TaxID=1070528 RepID=A0A6C0FBC7_9ZZZZ|tara:strand:+ start:3773 stop:4408 length:636 start_codon:yes stop_codon:yes gene_type:complete
MSNRITFGKYRSKKISYIFKIDRQYIKWLCSQNWYRERHNELFKESYKLLKKYKPIKYKDKFVVYTDGSCSNNGNENALSGIGIHFSEKNKILLNDVSEKIYDTKHSNNIAELIAIKKTLELLKSNNIKLPIIIYTDSAYCRSIIVEWYDKWVKNGLLNDKKNINLIEKTYRLYKSFNNIKIIHIKAHTNNTDEHSYGNRIADKLARNSTS